MAAFRRLATSASFAFLLLASSHSYAAPLPGNPAATNGEQLTEKTHWRRGHYYGGYYPRYYAYPRAYSYYPSYYYPSYAYGGPYAGYAYRSPGYAYYGYRRVHHHHRRWW